MDDEPPAAADDAALNLLVSSADALDASAAGACPEANTLAALADGTIDAGAREQTESHLSRCSACRCIAAISVADAHRAPGSGPGDGEEGRDRPAYPRAFGPYTLTRRLGGGGMGDVFEAEHAGRRRREALKQLRAGLDGDVRSAERFLREIRAVAGVAHEHVVPLYDSGTIDGVPYFTMPLLPGPSFAEIADEIRDAGEAVPGREANAVLDRHGVPAAPVASPDAEATFARRVAALWAGIADALAAIHDAGMLHRDVKPSNVLLDGRRRAVLTDFGLARLDASRITRATETLGTPAYMAPEQLVPGAEVDARADVYGLGAALYEVMTLHRPYEGRTFAETVALVLRGQHSPARTRNPRLPRDAGVILGRCLEARPADRYPTARAAARDLAAFARGEPIAARPMSAAARVRRALERRRLPVAIAATVLAVLGIVVGFAPGSLSVRATPSARLALDGDDAGDTPLANRSVAAGTHRIELRREKFAPMVRTVDVGRGATFDLDVVLRALDPADPETVALLASAFGVERADVKVGVERSPSPAADLAVLFPRGAVRQAPAEVSLWAESPATDVSVRLERLSGDGTGVTVHSWTIPSAFREVRLAVPPDVRRELAPGRHRIEIAAGGRPGMAAEFEVLTDADARRIGREIDADGRGFEAGDPSADFLRAERLIARGQYSEALDTAVRLRQIVGDRKEVGRLALAALDRAGLRDVGPWFDWAALYLRAEK